MQLTHFHTCTFLPVIQNPYYSPSGDEVATCFSVNASEIAPHWRYKHLKTHPLNPCDIPDSVNRFFEYSPKQATQL